MSDKYCLLEEIWSSFYVIKYSVSQTVETSGVLRCLCILQVIVIKIEKPHLPSEKNPKYRLYVEWNGLAKAMRM